MQDLCDQSGIPVRTIRFYITERLLAGPEGRGSATIYTEEHLTRLLLIREMSLQRLPLAEIRERLELVSSAELGQMLSDAQLRGRSEAATKAGSPKEYISAMLTRVREQRGGYEPAPSQALQSAQSPLASAASSRDLWRRIRLRPGVELHVSQEAERSEAEMIEQIEELARAFSKNKRRGTKDERQQ